MLLGLRTAIYRTPDLEAGKGERILAGDVLDPFGNVFGIIENPHFKLTVGGG